MSGLNCWIRSYVC